MKQLRIVSILIQIYINIYKFIKSSYSYILVRSKGPQVVTALVILLGGFVDENANPKRPPLSTKIYQFKPGVKCAYFRLSGRHFVRNSFRVHLVGLQISH